MIDPITGEVADYQIVEADEERAKPQETNVSLVAAAEQSKAIIQAKYFMAERKPRKIKNIRNTLLGYCDEPYFAEDVEYAKKIGGQLVTGLSIRFVEALVQVYGNIDIDCFTVCEDKKQKEIKVVVTDLESNSSVHQSISFAKTVERKNRKNRDVVSDRTNTYGEKVYIVKATEEEWLIKEAAIRSKLIRDLCLRLIPPHIKRECQERAQLTRNKKDAENPDAAINRILDSFSALRIPPKEIERYLGHDLDIVSPKEVDELRLIYQALKDGEATWHEIITQKTASEKEETDASMEVEKAKAKFMANQMKKEEKPPKETPKKKKSSTKKAKEEPKPDKVEENEPLAKTAIETAKEGFGMKPVMGERDPIEVPPEAKKELEEIKSEIAEETPPPEPSDDDLPFTVGDEHLEPDPNTEWNIKEEDKDQEFAGINVPEGDIQEDFLEKEESPKERSGSSKTQSTKKDDALCSKEYTKALTKYQAEIEKLLVEYEMEQPWSNPVEYIKYCLEIWPDIPGNIEKINNEEIKVIRDIGKKILDSEKQ